VPFTAQVARVGPQGQELHRVHEAYDSGILPATSTYYGPAA